MIKIQNIKREIISGAIVSIVLFFGQSIGLYLWQVLLKFSISTYSGFIDTVYSNAALGQRNWIDFLSFSILIYAVAHYIAKKSLRVTEKIKDIQKDKEEECETETEKTGSQKPKADKAKELIEKHIGKLKFILIFFNFFIYFSFLVILFIVFIDLQLNASFNQQLNTLAPYIDEQKEELFKSKWALMENRKDYEIIIHELEKTASDNRIKLPNLLVK